MVRIRPASARGRGQHGWLDSRHTFSFANYFDPEQMGFGPLRVINDDRVIGGAGFPTHPHRDMEIISYVVEGALEHRDSMGTGSVIRPGDVQRMSAGSGVTHSEYNHHADRPVRFLQIWVEPQAHGGSPDYAQKDFSDARRGRLCRVASPDGRDGSLTLKQDVHMYASELSAGESVQHGVVDGRGAWVQVVRGRVRVGDHELGEGDGAAVDEAGPLALEALHATEFLLFDVPLARER